MRKTRKEFAIERLAKVDIKLDEKELCDRIALNGCVKLINDLDMLSSIIDDVEKMDCEYDIISNSEFNYICDIIYSFEELC